MGLQSTRIRLFIQTSESSPDEFSQAAKKARNNADDSFVYGDIVFTIGARGSVYTDIANDNYVPIVAEVCKRRIKWCCVTTDASQVHALTQPGHYSGQRLGYDRLKAIIDKTGEMIGKPGVIVEGIPVEHVLELASLVATGAIAIKLNGEVIPIDQPE